MLFAKEKNQMNKYCSSVILIVSCFFISCSKKNIKEIEKNEIITTNELNNRVIQCMSNYDYEEVIQLISKGASPNLLYKNQSLLCFSTFNNLTDLSKKLIENGADVNWVDPSDMVSVFSNVIYNNNIELTKAFIANNVNFDYRNISGHNYFEESIFDKCNPDNPFFNDYRIAYLLLDNDKMRSIVEKDEKSIYSIIRNWSSEMPAIIDKIYGKDYIFPDNQPVLLISIAEFEIEALKYFISKNISVDKEYYYHDLNNYYKPLELANYYFQETYHNRGENSEFTKKMEDICILLENLN